MSFQQIIYFEDKKKNQSFSILAVIIFGGYDRNNFQKKSVNLCRLFFFWIHTERNKGFKIRRSQANLA